MKPKAAHYIPTSPPHHNKGVKASRVAQAAMHLANRLIPLKGRKGPTNARRQFPIQH